MNAAQVMAVLVCDQCTAEAYTRITYGTMPGHLHEAMLCQVHARELWNRCAPAINAGAMEWTNVPAEGE